MIDHTNGSFELKPTPSHSQLMQITSVIGELGFNLFFTGKEYSISDVKKILLEDGPGFFISRSRFQEDILVKSSPKTARELVAKRLTKLGPARELIITDPYLFNTPGGQSNEEYADFLVSLISPLLEEDASVKCAVDSQANAYVQELVEVGLRRKLPRVSLLSKQTNDFHDRFWITDRAQGVVIGTSVNSIGKKIFLIDSLRPDDVESVIREFSKLGI